MPRVRRRAKRRTAGYSAEHIRQLLTGHELISGIAFGTDDLFDEAGAHAAWEELRPTLLPEFVRKNPGRRPWSWWRWDSPAPGRRERIDGQPHPHDNRARTLYVAKSDRKDFWEKAYSLHFGLPGCFIPPFDRDLYEDFMRNRLQGRDSEIFEPEWSFLQRHNLLIDEDSA